MTRPDEDGGTAGGNACAKQVYLCDLEPSLGQEELRGMLSRYGDITNFEHIVAEEAAVLCEYATSEAAEEATKMLNHGIVKGRPCRCLKTSVVEAVRRTLASGLQRLVVEGLDATIESRGLLDLAALFGEVLDCKVENALSGIGFVHYADTAAAEKAEQLLSGMQIGESIVKVRKFLPKDLSMFTGCLYAAGHLEETPAEDTSAAAPAPAAPPSEEEAAPAKPRPTFDADALAHFAKVERHVVEVVAKASSRCARLREVADDYGPSHEQQMMVICDEASVEGVKEALSSSCDEVDIDAIHDSMSESELRSAIREFNIGNTFALILPHSVALRTDWKLTAHVAMTVFVCLPDSVQAYLDEMQRRVPTSSRVHCLFCAETDEALCRPLICAMEDADQKIPARLTEYNASLEAG